MLEKRKYVYKGEICTLILKYYQNLHGIECAEADEQIST